MATKKTNNGKSMDIQKAGEAAPDSTTRPILVSNRPMLQDPMVTPASDKPTEANKDDEEKPAPQTMASSAKTIEPPKDMEVPEAPADTTASDDSEKPVESEEPVDEKPPEVTDSISASEDSAVVDAVLANSNQGTQKSQDQKQEEEDAKRKQAVQVLVDSKKYFVPVGQVNRRKHNQQLVVILIILVAAAAGFFAVTTGLVGSPVAPALNFFKQLI